MRTQSIVLAALLGAVAFADPTLKQKLGQSKSLAQTQGGGGTVGDPLDCDDIEATAPPLDPITVVEPDLEWCPCNETLPELGAGV
jgi:hypothetical protein